MNESQHLLMLGAYRDNEVSPIHPFMVAVETLKQADAVVNSITLSPLYFARYELSGSRDVEMFCDAGSTAKRTYL